MITSQKTFRSEPILLGLLFDRDRNNTAFEFFQRDEQRIDIGLFKRIDQNGRAHRDLKRAGTDDPGSFEPRIFLKLNFHTIHLIL